MSKPRPGDALGVPAWECTFPPGAHGHRTRSRGVLQAAPRTAEGSCGGFGASVCFERKLCHHEDGFEGGCVSGGSKDSAIRKAQHL